MTEQPVTIHAETSPGEERAFAVAGDLLLDVAIHRPGRPDGVGDLHRATISTRAPALGGAFVRLPDADGFLPDGAGSPRFTEGAAVAVRVVRAAQGGKGPRLAAATLPPGPPGLVQRGPGAALRLAALHPAAPVLTADPALAATLRPLLGERLRLAAASDPAWWPEASALAQPAISLPGGMRATIHSTPALVAIDLDLAEAAAGQAGKQATHLARNRAALPELARQIRLRNLSGAILIDLAGLPQRGRAALEPDLAAALAPDPLRPRLLGFTRLGLAEIVRTRIYPPLHEILRGPHAAGLAALHAVVAAHLPGARPVLRCAPDVAAALDTDPVALPDLARRLGRPLLLRPDPAFSSCQWSIEATP